MHKLTVLYPEPTDRAAFREYYLNTHLPLCAKLPGVQEITYSLDVCEPGEGPYYAIFQATFADEAAMGAALSSPEGRAVEADVANYATGGVTVIPHAAQSFPVG
ncbi:EthD family reductase [Leucobacter celer]|uniref:EthD family reductase n=1 Tax=Leucobacter celer TaxID=668625 RepID=UPI0006A7D950|nr:EthD family reductase [Leucobacter celer]